MPLDVPSYAFALPDGVDPPSLVSFLAERFDIAADNATSLAFTVLDTADRRLRAAGVDVTLQRDRGVAALVLREQAGAAPLSADAGRRTASRRTGRARGWSGHVASDLGAGAVVGRAG